MANTNDTTTCTRTNEKNTIPIFAPVALIPSLSAKYILETNVPWGNLLDDSASLLGSGLEILRGILTDYEGRTGKVRDAERIYGVIYLLEGANTTLHEGHVVANRADPIGGHPDDFAREMDLVMSSIKEGRSSSAISMLECIKRNVSQSVSDKSDSLGGNSVT